MNLDEIRAKWGAMGLKTPEAAVAPKKDRIARIKSKKAIFPTPPPSSPVPKYVPKYITYRGAGFAGTPTPPHIVIATYYIYGF